MCLQRTAVARLSDLGWVRRLCCLVEGREVVALPGPRPHPVARHGHFRMKCGRCLVLATSSWSGLDLPALRRTEPFRALGRFGCVGLPCVATFAPGGSLPHGLCSIRRTVDLAVCPRDGELHSSAVCLLEGELQLLAVCLRDGEPRVVSSHDGKPHCKCTVVFPQQRADS